MSKKKSEVRKSSHKKEASSDENRVADNCGCFYVVDQCGCRVVDPCGCYVSQCCC